MNCSAPFPGPRGARGWDDSPAQPPERPPQLRALLLLCVVAVLVLGALSIFGAVWLAWWRSS